MGQNVSKPTFNRLQNSSFFSSKRSSSSRPSNDQNTASRPSVFFTLKSHPSNDQNTAPPSIFSTLKSRPSDDQNTAPRPSIFSTLKGHPSDDQNIAPRPSIFSTLKRPPVAKPNDFIPLFNDCISAASSRTQEYLLFKDPEEKFHPSPEVFTQVFLMTYISQSVSLNMTDTFNCTAMTPEQRILLGADWVWAVLEKPTKNPRIQIAVQVLHLPSREDAEDNSIPADACSESVQIAQESSNKNMYERMVDFCTSIGKDCYALFLFLGRKSDKGNIYGVLSNNFDAAIGKCDKIDRAFIENFFKGSRYLHTPSGMMQAIVTKREGDPLTLMIKFS